MAIAFLKCCSSVIWSWNRAISSWTDVTFSLLLHLRKPDIPVTSSMQQETKYRSLLALSSTFSGHPRNPRHNGRWFRLTEQAKAERFPYYSYPLCGRLIHIQSLLWLVTLARVRLSGSAGRRVIQCLVIVSDGTVRLRTLDGASHHIPLISVVISHGERYVAPPEMAKWQAVLLRRRSSSTMSRSIMSSWQSCHAECWLFDESECLYLREFVESECLHPVRRRVNGYKTLEGFYRDNSSLTFMSGIEAPMVFINSRDDPIVPNIILEDVRRHCSEYLVPPLVCPALYSGCRAST